MHATCEEGLTFATPTFPAKGTQTQNTERVRNQQPHGNFALTIQQPSEGAANDSQRECDCKSEKENRQQRAGKTDKKNRLATDAIDSHPRKSYDTRLVAKAG